MKYRDLQERDDEKRGFEWFEDDLKVKSEKENKKLNKIWSKMEIECSDILKVYRRYVKIQQPTWVEDIEYLERGARGTTSQYYKGKARSNRKPRDISQGLQDEIDNILRELKIPVLRSNSYFVSIVNAVYYGQRYQIFPLNGFKYLWFRNSTDLYNNLKKVIGRTNLFKNIEKVPEEKRREKLKKIILDFEPVYNKGLWEILKNRKSNEIMFTGSYYAIETYSPLHLFINNKMISHLK